MSTEELRRLTLHKLGQKYLAQSRLIFRVTDLRLLSSTGRINTKYDALCLDSDRFLQNRGDCPTNGIGGRKAARLFSREERGKVKDKFHRRKAVWDCVATLVRAGLTAQVAIDRIHHIYGENTTVTNIINRMKQDRRAGIVNPVLQV